MNLEHGVQLGPVLVVRLDPSQVHLDELLVGELSGVDGGLDVHDTCRQQIEGCCLGGAGEGNRGCHHQ